MARPKKTTRLRNRIFRVCLTDEEWHNLSEQADKAALTPSEFVRRRIVGYRVVSRVEDKLLNELRRLGGLQKHLASQLPAQRPEFNAILQQIVTTIKHADKQLYDDSLYNFEVDI
jgi:hypothetical protein